MSDQAGYVLRKMQHSDIPQVVDIDQKAFPIPWTANVYRYEIGQNTLSTMVVLSLTSPEQDESSDGSSGITGLLDRLFGNNTPDPGQIVGYGGFWFSQGEAHISTIASHPDYRRQGLGEILLAGMIQRAIYMNARVISLEVRITNAAAIALYHKHEFTQFGVKDRYYRDNGENAYDMRVSPVDAPYIERAAQRWAAIQERTALQDQFTAFERPRSLF